ncbi:1-acyl-sn-glycerol-3-phosphate acyltransferase [Gilvimarinus agarilyticus]|uniref:lysophospholipid acyltransferase family protein n=1 Tax=unclassified Gilvimarinus TaxID=2642066 RepID=UPI001C08D7B1|nr:MULTISPECIES: lysophospholipid acyltransferase family protein [unclassified Gilvimarinus]MBU2884229.1 1-acyl-sn-glycerol-3-phosphate acyltransferase [Gilvimarinus agarilyticus]MDO6569368.1 lysophospholipid acyltransferase family protein [Gilvimarinus sp. 2_MG-2023]MDO6747522.1 lysophospholipid acyltransferase family protein [Gilvimarinus sp. 1_MG-2023]
MLYLRTLLFNTGYYLTGIIAGTLSVLIWPLLPYQRRWRVITLWNCFVMFWLQLTCRIRVRVIDQRTSDEHPVVVMAKHQSTWETLFLQHYMAPISTILKKELMRIPFFGWGLAALKPIAIDRSNRIQALRDVKTKGIERLEEGISVLIFPEGTRMPLGEVGTYYRSGADIACAAQVSIVPVAHNGAECWPHKHFLKYPGTITVVIGEALSTENADRKVLTEQVKQWTESTIASLPLARKDGIYSPTQPRKD